MCMKSPIGYVFINKKDAADTRSILYTIIDAVAQKANQIGVAKLQKQIQTNFKVSNWVFLKQCQAPYSNIGPILQDIVLKLGKSTRLDGILSWVSLIESITIVKK